MTEIDGNPAFDEESIVNKFQELRKSFKHNELTSFIVDMCPVQKHSRKEVWHKCDEHDIGMLDPQDDNSEALTNIATIKHIAMLRSDADLDECATKHEEIVVMLDAMHSTETTTSPKTNLQSSAETVSQQRKLSTQLH